MRISLSLALVVLLGTMPLAAQIVAEVRPSGGRSDIVAYTTAGEVLIASTGNTVENLAVRPVPYTEVAAVTWSEISEGRSIPHQAITLDGHEFRGVGPTSYDLLLRYATFDPLAGSPVVAPHLNANMGGELWIVQYWTQGLEEYRSHLTLAGASVHYPLWNNANIVRMNGAVAASVQRMPFVRAVIAFHAAYKLDETLLVEQHQGWSSTGRRPVNVMAMERGLAAQQEIQEQIQVLGGKVEQLDPDTRILWATLDLRQIAEIARLDSVQWIDPRTETSTDMDLARTGHGATFIENAGGFDGAGVRGEVLDVGCNTAHQEFAATPLLVHGNLISASHGTSTTGQVFASGVDPQAKGMLHQGQGIAAYSSGMVGTRYNHSAELVNPALAYQAVFQTNSWGSAQVTNYTSVSSEMDTILFDMESLLILQSQSNTGNRTSRPQAWAKNMLSVGAAKHVNTLSTADDNWTGGASIGPAEDGRVKPELASWYDNLFTTTTPNPNSYTSSFGGTSGATPITAGACGLFFQMWSQSLFNNPSNGNVFASAPKNTTARAMMIASSTQWNWTAGGPNGDIDRDKQGWGRPDLEQLYNYRNKFFIVNEADLITNLQTNTYGIAVPAGESQLKVTLVFRDPPGTVNATKHLINDLDLTVTSPTGVVYRGNFGLTNHAPGATGENLWSVAGGTKENINSVENVWVQNPEVGNWTVAVTAAGIVSDNHPETAALDADYALVVMGSGTVAPFFNLQLATTGLGDASVTISNVPSGTIEGYTLLSEQANHPLGSGAFFGLKPTATTLTLLGQPVVPGSLFHWQWPVSGFFPDTPFAVGPGTLPPAILPIEAIGIAIGPGFTLTGVTPLRRLQ